MTLEDLFSTILAKAKELGFVSGNDNDGGKRPNSIYRKALIPLSFSDGKGYFGLIDSNQNTAGEYSGFSFVVFPNEECTRAVVSLCLGSDGFGNDLELAAMPGVRRMYNRFQEQFNDHKIFTKADFQDITDSFPELLEAVKDFESTDEDSDSTKKTGKTPKGGLIGAIDNFRKYIMAAELVDLQADEVQGLDRIERWLALYAKLREICSNKKQRDERDRLMGITKSKVKPAEVSMREQSEIRKLLDNRRYIVLQGAPGTGKTFTANKISKGFDETFFIQFHAETSYSDFVEGLQPKIDSKENGFELKKGVLVNAIEYARDHDTEKVLLIVDEINRANLSNVLGPVFYLFEPNTEQRNFKVTLANREYKELPSNLYVLATMNTADRSLSVVDFALRRRFAWYTLRPHEIEAPAGYTFDKDLFNKMNSIFDWYATDAELSLKPGQSYFLFKDADTDHRHNRIKYELMPLVKEYLTEGYLLKAKTAFVNFFRKKTAHSMSKTVVALPALTTLSTNVWSYDQFKQLGWRDREPYKVIQRFINLNVKALKFMGISAEAGLRDNKPVMIVKTSAYVGTVPLRSPMDGLPALDLTVTGRFGEDIAELVGLLQDRLEVEFCESLQLVHESRILPPQYLECVRFVAEFRQAEKYHWQKFRTIDKREHSPRSGTNWAKFALEQATNPARIPTFDNRRNILTVNHTEWMQLSYVLGICIEMLRAPQCSADVRHTISADLEWTSNYLRTKSIQKVDYFPERMSDPMIIRKLKATANRVLAAKTSQKVAWRVDFNSVFERYVQYYFEKQARIFGGHITCNPHFKITAAHRPAWALSYLEPDLIWDRGEERIVIDAKYKSHILNLNENSDTLADAFRHDLHQVVAYSSFTKGGTVKAWLVYPAKAAVERRFVIEGLHPARSVEVRLLGLPIAP